jgi:deoxycytidylate deaminase
MTEFDHLRIMVSRQSTCDKRSVAAGCYVGERFITSANHCEHTGQICPRLSLPSGCQSELCASTHAEIGLLNKLKAMKLDIIPAIVWIYGHYYACQACAKALADFGIRELRIKQL